MTDSPNSPDPPTRLTAFLELHGTFLYRVAFNLLRHQQDAEDAVQETLLKLVRTPGALDQINDERAFLAAAVWRVGLNRLQSAHARAQRRTQDITVMPIRDLKPDPEQFLSDNAERTLMRSLIDSLPDTLRQPLLLSAIEGMRGAEVASILGIPEATVRTRIHRAKAELRQAFLTATTPKQVRA